MEKRNKDKRYDLGKSCTVKKKTTTDLVDSVPVYPDLCLNSSRVCSSGALYRYNSPAGGSRDGGGLDDVEKGYRYSLWLNTKHFFYDQIKVRWV